MAEVESSETCLSGYVVNSVSVWTFHLFQRQNRIRKSADTDSPTDRQKDASDFIICPMLCYRSGTDENEN